MEFKIYIARQSIIFCIYLVFQVFHPSIMNTAIPWRFLQEGSPTTGPQPPADPATEELMVARQGTPRPPPDRRSKSRRLQPPPPPPPPPPPADNTPTDPEVRLRGLLLAEPFSLDKGSARLRRRSRRRLPRKTLQGILQNRHPSIFFNSDFIVILFYFIFFLNFIGIIFDLFFRLFFSAHQIHFHLFRE